MKNKALLIVFLFIGSVISRAQFIGGQLGMSYLFGLKPMVTLGAHFNTKLFDQPFSFGANYHLPIKMTGGTDYAYDLTTGDQIDLPYTEKISMFDVHVVYRYYFGDNSMEDGGLYGFGGGTFGLATDKFIPAAYDKTKYRLGAFFDPLSTSFFQPYLTLGLGYDKVLDNGHVLGGEVLVNLNATSYNSRSGASGDPTLPSMFGLRLTYSLPIGN